MKLHRLIKSLKEGGLWDEMVASMRAAAPPAPAIETAATLPPTAAPSTPNAPGAVVAAGAHAAPARDDPFLTPTTLKAKLRSLSTRLGDGRPYGKHGSTGAYREGVKYATKIIAEKGADPVAASKRLRDADVTVCAKTLKLQAKQVATCHGVSTELYQLTTCTWRRRRLVSLLSLRVS